MAAITSSGKINLTFHGEELKLRSFWTKPNVRSNLNVELKQWMKHRVRLHTTTYNYDTIYIKYYEMHVNKAIRTPTDIKHMNIIKKFNAAQKYLQV